MTQENVNNLGLKQWMALEKKLKIKTPRQMKTLSNAPPPLMHPERYFSALPPKFYIG